MKIPNKKIFAYIKKYDKLDFLDVRDKSTFNKFKVKDITHSVLQKVKSKGNIRNFNGHAFCYFNKTEENNKNGSGLWRRFQKTLCRTHRSPY